MLPGLPSEELNINWKEIDTSIPKAPRKRLDGSRKVEIKERLIFYFLRVCVCVCVKIMCTVLFLYMIILYTVLKVSIIKKIIKA